ncbi:MAG: hypothetical protein HYZ28_05805 [Myxococcales bacterium]|nr:hypothetical protein [Myxococcales bacterium]
MKRVLRLLWMMSLTAGMAASAQGGAKPAEPAKPAEAAKVTISPKDKKKAEELLAKAKADLAKFNQLMKIDKEKCCVKAEAACYGCALMSGDCPCKQRLLAGNTVCPECNMKWHMGMGLTPDKIKPEQVKNFVDDVRVGKNPMAAETK